MSEHEERKEKILEDMAFMLQEIHKLRTHITIITAPLEEEKRRIDNEIIAARKPYDDYIEVLKDQIRKGAATVRDGVKAPGYGSVLFLAGDDDPEWPDRIIIYFEEVKVTETDRLKFLARLDEPDKTPKEEDA